MYCNAIMMFVNMFILFLMDEAVAFKYRRVENIDILSYRPEPQGDNVK